MIREISNGTLAWSELGRYFDGGGGTFLPTDGSPAVADQPWVDLVGATVAQMAISAAQAVALSAHACGTVTDRDSLSWYTSCNQPGPLPAGDYLAVASMWESRLPDPFPQPSQCVDQVWFDVDGDPSTGFQSNLPFNPLIGADVYYEALFFWDQAGDFRNYILATDHRLPARPDTGEIHGNLATNARAFASPFTENWPNALFIPRDEVEGQMSVGGFCFTDRAATGPEALSVDALGDPADPEFPMYVDLADLLFPPRAD